MQPLIDQFTKNLSSCSGCGTTDLSDPFYDQFFQPKQKEKNADNSEQTNRDRSGDGGGGDSEGG
jgi:hypothetical protein